MPHTRREKIAPPHIEMICVCMAVGRGLTAGQGLGGVEDAAGQDRGCGCS